MIVNEQGQPVQQTGQIEKAEKPGRASGQALVEYALIASLVMIGIIAVLTITGPTVGNIFSNTVYNLLGQTFNTQPMPGNATIFNASTALATLTPPSYDYKTITPLIPTCASGPYINKWAPTVSGNDGLMGTYWWPCSAAPAP